MYEIISPAERRRISVEAARQVYWAAARETCANIRRWRRRGVSEELIAAEYRRLHRSLCEWREARDTLRRLP